MSHVDRLFGSVEQWATLIAPQQGPHTDLGRARVNYHEHRLSVKATQRLRAAIYREDGAVRADQLTFDERWEAPKDYAAWHLVVGHERGMCATMWYDEHPSTLLYQMHSFHPATRRQLMALRERAATEGVKIAEMGGWVATTAISNLLILSLALVLHRALGPALAPVIITTRHHASEMLVKHGGADRCGAEPYWDDRFGCEMELLVVDSRDRKTKYEDGLDLMASRLHLVPSLLAYAAEARVSA